jgi:replicative DNA helicase
MTKPPTPLYKPHKPQIEQNVLGSILLANHAWDDVADILTAEDFYLHHHKIIFNAMAYMINSNEPVDWVTLTEKLKSMGELEKIGGEGYLLTLMNGTASAVNVKHYAMVVKQASYDRLLMNHARTIIGLVEKEVENRLDEAQKLILSISDNKTSEPLHFKDFLPEVFRKIMDREHATEKNIGISCGYEKIDKVLYGLRPKNLIILAARPSVGKTLLALNISEYVAINLKKTVFFVSLEMTKEELAERFIASLSGLKSEQIKEGKYNSGEHEKAALACDQMLRSNFITDDNPVLSIMDIRAKCRRIKRKYGLDLLVVDYLQLIKGVKAENETIKIGYISHGLKQIAKELNIPVLALCQLNRDIEKRINKKPIMSDLRQSGNIEQDADVVIFIDRKELHDDAAPKGIADIYISKNRDGGIGELQLGFRGDYCRFDNLSDDYVPVPPSSTGNKKSYKSFYEN